MDGQVMMMMHAASSLGNRCTLPSDADYLHERLLTANLLPKSQFRGCIIRHDYCSAIKETDVLLGALRLGKDPSACLHCLFHTSHCAMQSPVLMKPLPCR